MLKKVSPGWDFFLPLLSHSLVHGVFSLAIILFVRPSYWWLSLIDLIVHFLMDRIKAGPRYLGRFNDKNRSSYWNSLGFDQMIHHLTHIGIVWILIQR